ncbi:hypothetical protein CDZ97_13340 [Mameliella alba]|nr:hypothetical protein CDZ95_14555 [Mameliella alba]OWV63983.1 hypothetical protein CDZ97_13340 [Mameliella alba]
MGSPLGIVLGPMADQYLTIDEEVDLGREATTRTAKTLSRSPPLTGKSRMCENEGQWTVQGGRPHCCPASRPCKGIRAFWDELPPARPFSRASVLCVKAALAVPCS